MKNVFIKNNGRSYNGIVAAYMRYSSNNQDETSIEYQREAIEEYAVKKGLFIATEYIDEACTGTNDRREGFQQMLVDAKNNPQWNKILVYDLSRFARNSKDAITYIADMEDLDIQLISVTQDFDIKTGEGKLMRHVLNALNEYYSLNLAKHTHAGLKQKAEKAIHCGGLPPLGYDIVKDKLVINEDEAELVKRIFDMYEKNFSYSRMADELNNRGYKTKAGLSFKKTSFASILRQEKYVGTYVWNKTRQKNNKGRRNSHKQKPEGEQIRIPNSIPMIITPEQFERVQKMLLTRQAGSACSKSRNYYLLSGGKFLKCAVCGALMIGSIVNSHSSTYKYYYCPNHKKKVCSNKGIRADLLDKFVINAVVSEIFQRKDLITLYNSLDDHNKIRRIKQKLSGLEKAKKNLIRLLKGLDDDTLLEDIKMELNANSDEKAKLEAELHELETSLDVLTEEERKTLCKRIARMMRDDECLEVKKYLGEVIEEIKISNADVELTLKIA